MSLSPIPEGEREFTRLLGPVLGYGIVVGIGFAFAALMVVLTYLQKRFTKADPTSAAEFASAGRSVKPGLIAAGVVSAWTWSATLLQSSTATYQLGLSAAWWYGVGGTIQVAMFAMIAAKVKQNANGATTFLQIVNARYGMACHLLFTFYALVCFHVVSGSLVLGCAATVNALTGMNTIAACFLLPIGIAVYVIAGGLRATLVVDFFHSSIMFIILYLFVFSAWATSDQIGSPTKMWELLTQAAIDNPVANNAEGSYMTFRSNGGLVFVACTIASGFAGVFCDQGYWQRAIASQPESTTKAYMLGGLSWFPIPWAFGSTMGLAARALIRNPNFPTFPYALSAAQQSAGLVAPAAAVTLLGKGGAAAVLVVVFMAATSAMSAEMIAVSSILTYDLAGTYWKQLSGKQVVTYSHITIALIALWMGCWATILNKAGIDLGWLFYFQGTACSPAVIPIGLTVCWRKMSCPAALYGTLFGGVMGMLGWFIGCWKIYGEINTTNLAESYSAICGSLPGLIFSALAVVVLTYLYPDTSTDWNDTRAIQGSNQIKHGHHPAPPEKPAVTSPGLDSGEEDDKKEIDARVSPVPDEESATESDAANPALDHALLQRTFVRAAWLSLALTLAVLIIIPMPMFGQSYVFSAKFLTGFIAIAMVWLLLAGVVCVLLPVWESRREMWLIARGIMGKTSGEKA